MKLTGHQAEAALKTANCAGLLIHGGDWGLVRERALTAIRSVLGIASSPFRLVRLIREEHGRLRDEAGSLALGGGRKVIHVHDASDGLAAALERLVFKPADTLLVIEAGELQTRSKLRTFAEKRPDWGAIACPVGNTGQISADVQDVLARTGLSATPDALTFLCQELAGESITRRSELEKLSLYALDADIVDLDTARLSCSPSMETSLGAAVSAALSGQSGQCDVLLSDLAQEGATGAGLLAVLSIQVQRLLKVRLLIDSGLGADEACLSLTPPLYPRQAAGLLRDVRGWQASALEALGHAIREADRACKRAASPDFAIASRLVATIAGRQAARA